MNTAQDFKVGNLGRPNNRELGYIDAEMPKPLVHHIILIGQNGMHLLWDMKFVTKSIKCFVGSKTDEGLLEDTSTGTSEILGKPNIGLTYGKRDSDTPQVTLTPEFNREVRPHGKTNGLPLIVQEITSSLGLVQDSIHWPSPIITPDLPF
ncbi:hypothetical protein Tco_0813043 [Tanacetum coccineum]